MVFTHVCTRVHTKFSIYARISARQSLKLQISNLCSCISCHTVLLFNSPWSSPFSKILEVVSRPEFAQDHESGLRSDRGPVVLCDFSKLRYWKSPYKFFKFVWEILPIQPTIQTRKKISPPSFFSKMRTFFKNWPRWLYFYHNSAYNQRGRFLKNVLIFKRGGADAFSNDPPFSSKGTVRSCPCGGR
jgi:hypothetical protein